MMEEVKQEVADLENKTMEEKQSIKSRLENLYKV